MIFKDFAGKAEVFVDGKSVGVKTDPAIATFDVPVAPGDQEHHVVVIVESPLGQPVGLGGMVTVTNAGVSSVTQ
jgi:hypothetical protein